MRVIAVDDERLAMQSLQKKLESINRITEIHTFTSPQKAIDFFAENGADIAFLDINMSQMNGIDLANRLRELHPDVSVIFITGYANYSLEAFKLHADGYLMKPVDEKDINLELDNLERRHALPATLKHIRAQTFGSFEFFVDDVPVHFKRSKTKELLAYLIDRRGAAVSTAELCAVLWEKQLPSETAYMRHLIADLKKTLSKLNASELLITSRNSYSININKLDCDAYRFRQHDRDAINAYNGEYMSQYSWAELSHDSFQK